MLTLLMKELWTVEEIIETFDELVLEEETGTLLCEICYVEKESQGSKYPGKFDAVMEEELGEEEENKKQNRKFINLKKSLKRHFETDIHIKNWNIWSTKNDEKRAMVKRMRLARLCYVDYKEGNSKRHYEQEVLKAVQNGLDMDEINRSDRFPRKFRPFATRLSKREGALNITKDATKIAETEVMSLVSKLYSDLSKEIFE